MRIEKDGYVFDTEAGFTPKINEYIAEKGIMDTICYWGQHGEHRHYILVQHGHPIYHSTSVEAISAHIDWMALQVNF